jgi:hypothetical protein
MSRGQSLQDHLLPILTERIELLDEHIRGRIERMCSSYGLATSPAGSPRRRSDPPG